MGNERITYENLLGISACVALALIAHLSSLPLWVPVVVVVCALIRLSLARKGRGAPPRSRARRRCLHRRPESPSRRSDIRRP